MENNSTITQGPGNTSEAKDTATRVVKYLVDLLIFLGFVYLLLFTANIPEWIRWCIYVVGASIIVAIAIVSYQVLFQKEKLSKKEWPMDVGKVLRLIIRILIVLTILGIAFIVYKYPGQNLF